MTTLLLILVLSAPSDQTIGNNMTVGGTASAAALSAAGMAKAKEFSYPTPTTDTAPSPVTVKATNAWSQATTTNRNGAALILSGGLPSTLMTVVSKAASSGDTITFARTIDGVTPANVVWTEGTQYACAAAASNAACALAIYTYCNANLPSGVQGCYCTDGTCSDAKVFVRWIEGSVVGASITSSDDAGISDNSSLALLDGQVQLPTRNVTATPTFSSIGDTDTGINFAGSNTLAFVVNGGNSFYANTTGFHVSAANTYVSTNVVFEGTSGATVSSPDTGSLRWATVATLGACAAAGDVGKFTNYVKSNVVHLCYCKQTGSGTYAWTTVFAGGDCT